MVWCAALVGACVCLVNLEASVSKYELNEKGLVHLLPRPRLGLDELDSMTVPSPEGF